MVRDNAKISPTGAASDSFPSPYREFSDLTHYPPSIVGDSERFECCGMQQNTKAPTPLNRLFTLLRAIYKYVQSFQPYLSAHILKNPLMFSFIKAFIHSTLLLERNVSYIIRCLEPPTQ